MPLWVILGFIISGHLYFFLELSTRINLYEIVSVAHYITVFEHREYTFTIVKNVQILLHLSFFSKKLTLYRFHFLSTDSFLGKDSSMVWIQCFPSLRLAEGPSLHYHLTHSWRKGEDMNFYLSLGYICESQCNRLGWDLNLGHRFHYLHW